MSRRGAISAEGASAGGSTAVGATTIVLAVRARSWSSSLPPVGPAQTRVPPGDDRGACQHHCHGKDGNRRDERQEWPRLRSGGDHDGGPPARGSASVGWGRCASLARGQSDVRRAAPALAARENGARTAGRGDGRETRRVGAQTVGDRAAARATRSAGRRAGTIRAAPTHSAKPRAEATSAASSSRRRPASMAREATSARWSLRRTPARRPIGSRRRRRARSRRARRSRAARQSGRSSRGFRGFRSSSTPGGPASSRRRRPAPPAGRSPSRVSSGRSCWRAAGSADGSALGVA